VHEAQPQHAVLGVDAKAFQTAHAVEVSAPGHDPARGQRRGEVLAGSLGMDGDGGGLVRRSARPDQADGIAGAEEVQQRLEQGIFIVA